MPGFPPSVTIDRPKSGQGGGGEHPPRYGGGGDNGPGDGSPDYGRRLYRARLGLLLGLISISILFVTVTAVFFLMRHGAPVFDYRTNSYIREWVEVNLPVRLLLINTFVLLLSSVTIEMARRAVAREMALEPIRSLPGIAVETDRGVPWLAITVFLGLIFLGGQWMAWENLRAHGFHISTRTPTPFFYILTGAHAVHLVGGLIVLLYAGMSALLRRPIEQRRIVVEIATWYWHFMGILWVYIFALLQFGR
jgi:cytochrome c oxidase subunit III